MKILQQNQSLVCDEIFPTDFVDLLFPNLMLFQILLFPLYFGKFVNSLLNYPQKERSLQNFKPLFPVILRIFDHEYHGETSLKVASVKFVHVFMKFRKLESLHQENIKLDHHKTVAVPGDALQEKVFSEISQNSQGNTCARVSFLIKLQAWAKLIDVIRLEFEKLFNSIQISMVSKAAVHFCFTKRCS